MACAHRIGNNGNLYRHIECFNSGEVLVVTSHNGEDTNVWDASTNEPKKSAGEIVTAQDVSFTDLIKKGRAAVEADHAEPFQIRGGSTS